MKHLLTIISCLLALNLTAQEVVVEYPYNPDFENDGNVGVEDLMQLLASFGMGFDVDELTIDEIALSEWLQAISETLVAQQAIIDSLSSVEMDLIYELSDEVTAQQAMLDSLNSILPTANSSISDGVSIAWPFGCSGRVIVHHGQSMPFIVPEDSVLMVTYASHDMIYSYEDLEYEMSDALASLARPLPFGDGAAISIAASSHWFTGILVPKTEGAEVVFWNFSDGPFLIPEEKTFIARWGDDGYGGNQILGFFDPQTPVFSSGVLADVIFEGGTELYDGSGVGGALGYLIDYNYFESSIPNVASETESLGLVFGEKEFWDLDILEWLQIEFPQMDVAFIEAQTDGILHVDGTDVDYPPYGLAVVPSALLPCDDFDDCNGMTIASIFMGNDFENYQYNDFSISGGSAPVTIAVKEGEVICLRRNSYTASWQRFIWVPIVSDSSAYNEPVSQGPSNAISDTLIIDVGDQYSDWYGSPVPFAAEKPFVKFVGQAPVNPCYFELAIPNDSVPDVVIFNDSENIVRGNTFTGGNYLLNNEWIQLRAIGDEWFKPWYDH